MEFQRLTWTSSYPPMLRKYLIILAFLPVLTIQNSNGQGDDHPVLQCTAAVSRCLFNYGWNISDTQCSHQKYITSTPSEGDTNVINELRATYGNITERLDRLSKFHNQSELLQHIKALTVTLNSCQDLSNNRKIWDLTTGVETLKKELQSVAAAQKGTEELILLQKQLIECRENLNNSQHNGMRLKECKENLTYVQRDAKQLSECKETLANCEVDMKQLSECKETVKNSETDMNGLRLLVRERYIEYDVVRAARQNDLKKVRLLLDAGMRVDSRDKNSYNNTALHVACLGGYLDMISFLVKRGAPLEARNLDKNTPLIDAVAGNHLPAVQLMIRLGANPLARGWHGETPRDRATRNGHVEVAKWLKDSGW